MAALNEETATAMVASLIVAAALTDGIAFPKPALPQEPQLAHVGNTHSNQTCDSKTFPEATGP
jgi:hypothetical protein